MGGEGARPKRSRPGEKDGAAAADSTEKRFPGPGWVSRAMHLSVCPVVSAASLVAGLERSKRLT